MWGPPPPKLALAQLKRNKGPLRSCRCNPIGWLNRSIRFLRFVRLVRRKAQISANPHNHFKWQTPCEQITPIKRKVFYSNALWIVSICSGGSGCSSGTTNASIAGRDDRGSADACHGCDGRRRVAGLCERECDLRNPIHAGQLPPYAAGNPTFLGRQRVGRWRTGLGSLPRIAVWRITPCSISLKPWRALAQGVISGAGDVPRSAICSAAVASRSEK
jgi:hypothetical protein